MGDGRERANSGPEDDGFLGAIGDRLRTLRARRGVTRRDLSRLSRVSERYIAQVEAGDGNVSILLLRRIARALGLGVEELVAERPERTAERLLLEQVVAQLPEGRLAEARDALGLRRAALDWRLSELDARTVRAAVLGYARRMAERDTGRARLHDWVLPDPIVWPDTTQDEVAGKHHMGATRMAADPARGVVDADCRVHGIGNLYIGGSSVFATSGKSKIVAQHDDDVVIIQAVRTAITKVSPLAAS